VASVYTVQLVHSDGTVVRTLVNAVVKSISSVLNGVGQCTFTFPKIDPPGATGQGADVRMLDEVQVLRDGAVWWWGVMVLAKASSNAGDVTVTASDLGWYLTRRAIDKVPTNFLLNPQFESGLTSWVDTSSSASVATDLFILGTQAVRQTGGASGADHFLGQTVSVTTGSVIGILFTLVAWVYIESFSAVALGGRGLYVEALDGGGTFQYSNFVAVDETTTVGDWTRLQTTIFVPKGVTWTLGVRLYTPAGSIVWDATGLYEMESLGRFNADITDLAKAVVEFIQDPTLSGKDDLHIATAGAATGVVLPSKWWQFADHTFADRALDEFVQWGASHSIDWTVEVASRTFTVWPYPGRGVDRTGSVTLQLGSSLSHYDYTEDGSTCSTDVTVLGNGSGPDREIGNARDVSVVPIVLQDVSTSTPDAPINALLPQAQDRLRISAKAARLPVGATVQAGGDLVGLLGLGDKVTVSIADGWVQYGAPGRIVQIDHDTLRDALSLTLNEVP